MSEDATNLGILIERTTLPPTTGMDALEARMVVVQEIPLKKEVWFFTVRGEAREQTTTAAALSLLRASFPEKAIVNLSDVEKLVEISSLRVEAARMRPVYEAAKAWRPVSREARYSGVAERFEALEAAVDAAVADEGEGNSKSAPKIRQLSEIPAQPLPTSWGRWTLDEQVLVLTHADPFYEVDLEKCTTSAEALDWIAQVARKQWATAEDVGNLVRAFNDTIGLQENLCGGGGEHTLLDVAATIRRYRQMEGEER